MSDSEKLDRLLTLIPRLERIEKMHADVLCKRLSRSQQAKKAGVSRTTLWRREKRLRLQRAANPTY